MSDTLSRTARQTKLRRASRAVVPLVAAGDLLAPSLAQPATSTSSQLTGTRVTWNVKGPAGAVGPAGPAGPKGDGLQGLIGPTGAAGPAGSPPR